MASCCDPNGLSRVFGAERARSDAQRYRKSGLSGESRAIRDFLVVRGIVGGRVLDIGGGVGGLGLDLVRAGAASAESIDISAAYAEPAAALARELDAADRVAFRVANFARDNENVAPADAVILNKVICCYPDMPGLVAPAAARARRWLVLVFPADHWWVRLGLRMVNLVTALFRSAFRAYFNEPAAVVALARGAGLEPAVSRGGIIWHFLAMERA